MIITVNKKIFVDSFLNPISKLSENITLEIGDKSLKTLASSADNSTILLAEINCKIDSFTKSVIPDCKSFLRLLAGIEEEEITLNFDSNVIRYQSKSFSFKYHLLDEAYALTKKSFNETKLKSIQYDTSFSVSKKVFSEILRYNSIVPDAEKLYFFTQGTDVHCRLADEQKSNINEIQIHASSSFEGKQLPNSTLVLNVQNLLLTSFVGEFIEVSINHDLKVFKFKTDGLTYIISGLVK